VVVQNTKDVTRTLLFQTAKLGEVGGLDGVAADALFGFLVLEFCVRFESQAKRYFLKC
jgi:hypothetical protein